jgi:maltose O-acetyltransferase
MAYNPNGLRAKLSILVLFRLWSPSGLKNSLIFLGGVVVLRPLVARLKRVGSALRWYTYNGLITHVPLYCVRHAYLKNVLGIAVGAGSSVHMGCFITGNNITIGAHSVINRNCYLDGRGELCIGDNVSIGPECYLLSMTHEVNSSDFAPLRKKTVVGDYVWTGARVLLLPGVEMQRGSVAGAGAVVTRSVDARVIVGGNPARALGERTSELSYSLSYFPLFNTDV